MSEKSLRDIVIVGGGTAGWLTAAYLRSQLGDWRDDKLSITVVDSDQIPAVGVGEATIPSIRQTLAALDVDEREFMRATSATFKLAIRFDGWLNAPGQKTTSDKYYHAFGKLRSAGAHDFAPFWVLQDQADRKSFAESAFLNPHLCEAMRAAKRPSDPPFGGPLVYAYHFDAQRLAAFLKELCVQRGVHHVNDRVLGAETDDEGGLSRLKLEAGSELNADFFVDCTGFRSRLIGDALGAEFTSVGEALFCDRAVTFQVPHAAPGLPVRPFTLATATKAGWIWDIDLDTRRGFGHVYSSQHMSDETAETVLRSHIGAETSGLEARLIEMRCGYIKTPWIGNCVAVGLSGGFLEPLESTGIYLIEAATSRLASMLPMTRSPRRFAAAARQFNAQMSVIYRTTIDFLKLHYALSRRDDSGFWLQNRDPDTYPASLKDRLLMWHERPPAPADFPLVHEPFKHSSYQQVLYGMETLPEISARASRYRDATAAHAMMEKLATDAASAQSALPDHRAMIDQINGRNVLAGASIRTI